MPRWIVISLAVAAGLLSGTAPAGATTVNSVSEYLEITGDPGNVNDLRLRHDLDRQVLRIEDSVPIARRNLGGPACTAPGPTVVECPYPPAGPPAGSQFRFFVELGDRDDRLLIDAPRVSPEIYVGAGIFTEVADGPGNEH